MLGAPDSAVMAVVISNFDGMDGLGAEPAICLFSAHN